jgi:hypothetical protein
MSFRLRSVAIPLLILTCAGAASAQNAAGTRLAELVSLKDRVGSMK